MERLHVNYLRETIHRLRVGQSDRAISRDMRLSRHTVRKYRELAAEAGYLDPSTPLPEALALAAALGPEPRPPVAASTVLPYREVVIELLEQGVEMMTIFDRLRDSYGYSGSYTSIRRFVHGLRPREPRVTVRVHSAPGEEAQVDFGYAGALLDPITGAPHQAYVFIMTLSFSRHQYAELVFDQKIPTWLALHRRAFQSFGGVPARVVLDNLKAAVLLASLHDPVLSEPYRRFAQHYGFIVSPNRPATPEHKGKVENNIHFFKRSFLAGQQFSDIREANGKLAIWVRERAGTRRHGTTQQPPLALFETHERRSLLPLPAEPFELVETRIVKVHPDCHVTIGGSYYSVPYRYVGRSLDAYIFERVVQLFLGTELVATHPRASGKGEWHTRLEHYPSAKAAFLERTPARCRQIAAAIGPATSEVVETLLEERPLDRLRSVQAILRLAETTGGVRLELACRRALFYGDPRYRRIKAILDAALDQAPLPEGPYPVSEGDSAEGRAPVASPWRELAAGLAPQGPLPVFAFQRQAVEFFPPEEVRR